VAEAPYVLGDHFTLVDLANAAPLLFPTRRGLSLDPYPRVKEWFARVTGRPALATATRE
jgi:glutathione S-transferase